MSTIDTPTRIYIALGALRGCLESAEAISAGLPETIAVTDEAAAVLSEAARHAREFVNHFGRFNDLVNREAISNRKAHRVLAKDISDLGGGPEDGGNHPAGCNCDACDPS